MNANASEALDALCTELNLFTLQLMEFAQAGRKVLLAKKGDHQFSRILGALRKFKAAGGDPFEDKRFVDFFQIVLQYANAPSQQIPENLKSTILNSERTSRVKYCDPSEQAKDFVRTVVRMCGGKWSLDGTVSLVPLSKRQPKTRNP